MTHLHIGSHVEIEFVGTLFLVGVRENLETTTVQFICQCSPEAPLARYFSSWGRRGNSEDILSSRVQEVTSVDELFNFVLFSNEVKGSLKHSRRFLEATACKLLRELRHAEDVELSNLEMEDQLNWADDQHYGNKSPMPDFSRPRH